MQYINELLAEAYCISLRQKYYAVERVGDYEYRMVFCVQVHIGAYLADYVAVDIRSESHGFGKSGEL